MNSATRGDGPKNWDADTVRWNLKGRRDPITMRLNNGMLTHVFGTGPAAGEPDAEFTLDEASLRAILLGVAMADRLAGSIGIADTPS